MVHLTCYTDIMKNIGVFFYSLCMICLYICYYFMIMPMNICLSVFIIKPITISTYFIMWYIRLSCGTFLLFCIIGVITRIIYIIL